MKCIVCQQLEMRSKLYNAAGSSIFEIQVSGAFWDEDGVQHVHSDVDPTQTYQCSKGHLYIERNASKCPACDYGRSEKNYEFIEPEGFELDD